MTAIENVPDYVVTVNGTDITGKLKGRIPEPNGRSRARLIGLRLSEKRGGDADELELTIDDSDGGMALPPTGATIEVSLGWSAGSLVNVGLVDKGRFTVDSVEHSGPPDIVTVRARSADMTSAIVTRREQSWSKTTLGAVLHAVAARNGLTPRIAPALADIAVTTLSQARESDMALLRRLGREHDAVATVKGGALIFSAIGAGITSSGKPIPGAALTRAVGDRHSFRIEKREEVGTVEASWHDRKGAKKQVAKAGKGEGTTRRLTRTYPSEAAAKQAARAEHSRAARAPMKLDLGLALGRLDLYPDRPVTVSGFKAEIDQVKWLIADITHELQADRGFVSAVTLENLNV